MILATIATSESSALVAASQWLVGLLTGSLATGIAIIAIAFVGFGMLGGRIDLRRGASAILGCFLLFGAPVLVDAFSGLARGDEAARPAPAAGTGTPPPPKAPPPRDPYAGASLIQDR